MTRLYAVPLGILGLAFVTALEMLPAFANVRADPCAILVTYLAFRFDMLGGIFSAMLLGFILDTVTGAPVGLHMMSLQILFVLLRIVANAVQLEPGLRVMMLAIAVGAAWFHAFLVTVMIGVFGEGGIRTQGLWQSSLPSVVANLLIGIPLIWACHRLAQWLLPESDHMFIAR